GSVAPGAEMSVAPDEPSRFRSKKTVPWAVWGATWKSRVIIQSGIPSPLASAGARIAWSMVTGSVTDAEERDPTKVVRVKLPIDAVIVTFPKGAIAPERAPASLCVTQCGLAMSFLAVTQSRRAG